MNKMKRLTGRKILLVAVAFCAFGFAKAQDTQTEKNTLTLTLDKALEIALDENPTMKVAAEEIALKRVASKEAWQSLLPEASIAGSLDHTIKAAEMKLNDMSFKMGQDGSNTANAGLSINLPLFVPGGIVVQIHILFFQLIGKHGRLIVGQIIINLYLHIGSDAHQNF